VILRELFVSLGLDLDEQAFAKGELAAELVKGALEKVVEVAKETAEKFVEMIKETAEYGKETKEAAQATGLTTEALQQLRGAARAVGLDAGDLDVGIFKLSRTMAAAKKGSEEATAALKKVKFQEGGKLRAADEVLGDIADQFAAMPDGAEKTARAMDIFGRSGARMIPLLNKGRAGIDALRASAVVLTDEQLEAGEELVKTQKQLANMTTKLWRGAIAPLLPAINDLLKRYLAWRKANAEIMRQNIQKYIGYVIKAVGKLADLFSFLVRNAKAVELILGTAGLIGIFEALSVAAIESAVRTAIAWVAAAAPFVALAALIAGILLVFDDIRVYQQGGKSLYGRFKKEIEDWLKPRDQDPWWLTAIKDLVRLLHDAIELVHQLDDVMGRSKPALVNARSANQNSPEWKKQRVAAGPLTAAEAAAAAAEQPHQLHWWEEFGLFGALNRQADARYRDARVAGSSVWDAAKAGFGIASPPIYRPPAAAPAGAPAGSSVWDAAKAGFGIASPPIYRPPAAAPAGAPTVVAPVNVQVYGAPGMDEQQVGQIVADKVQEHWDNQMEAAAAAAGP
jgi:hypothetical protein